MTTVASGPELMPVVQGGQPATFPIPADLGGFWMLDPVHAPRPVTPLSEEILVAALDDGFRAGLHEVGYPFGMGFRAVHTYVYAAFVPHEPSSSDDEEPPAWNDEASAAVVGSLRERWEREWLPSILPGLERLRTTEYAALSDGELLATFAELRRNLFERWKIHGVLLFTYQAASTFEEFYRAAFNPGDPMEPYQLLNGFQTRSYDGDCSLWRLSRKVRESPALSRIFAETPPDGRIAALARDDEGRALLARLHAHLDEYGWRMDSILELAEPTWLEDLNVPLNILHGLVAQDDAEDPAARLARMAERRERLLAQARARLADDPDQLARFEALYAPARNHVVLDEDHNVYIDQMGNAGLRFPVLELGRRLVRHGTIEEIDDVFMLTTADIRAGIGGADQRALVDARRAEMAHWAAIAPPPSIGDPPPDDEIDPFMAGLIKTSAPPPPPSIPSVIRGTAGSAGTVRGRAKVARSLEDATSVMPGQILVCEMTLPAWSVLFATIGAVVTDTGGILSHSATVAREYGIPCVVGTGIGTTTIRDGMLLEVNGTTGEVRILAGPDEPNAA
jgi:rifampicin phosphotransferase